jgi:short chain dehydrogenase
MTTKTSLPQSFTLADLSGRRTLVTGAGRGIGLAIARRLVAGGARVAIADVDENGARAAAKELGKGSIALRCDVRSTADADAAVAAVVAEFGGLDGRSRRRRARETRSRSASITYLPINHRPFDHALLHPQIVAIARYSPACVRCSSDSLSAEPLALLGSRHARGGVSI